MADKSNKHKRIDGRKTDEIRPVRFKKNFVPAATGSVLISMGDTRVICAVMVENKVPGWMKQQNVSGGWLTAEYSMLPYASDRRTRRDSSTGRVGGRTHEIQRLIGRSLRAVVDLEVLGARTLWIDCDVIQADGGTRTASITGAYVALKLAVQKLLDAQRLEQNPILDLVSAISVGVVDGEPLLDLCYDEDFRAEVDMNVVMTGSGKYIEVQGTAEGNPFSSSTMNRMLTLAKKGTTELTVAQQDLF